jgi:hypothetical protein
MHYTDWHISILENNITLSEAHASLKQVGAEKKDIPLIVKLIENPKFSIPGLTFFHGAVNLLAHDYIHILLGRGLMPADEAFTIGYTMGSTRQVSSVESSLFELISKHLYPHNYKFKDRDISIFHAALKLAENSNCQALDQVDYQSFLKIRLKKIRDMLGINTGKIIDYYKTEKKLYPDSKASCRLLGN